MKVSVVLPTYNRAPYLKIALDSVLAQTYFDYEVIVVDDGSTDNTKELVASYDNPNIRYFYLEKGGGPSKARNFGIHKAVGDAIAFLDSDDTWDSDKLECQVHVLNEHPSAGLIFSDFRYTNANGVVLADSVLQPRYSELTQGIKIQELIEDCPIKTDAVLIKKEVFNRSGLFDEKMVYAEDLDLWIRISLSYFIYFIDRPLTTYRLHSQQLTRLSRQKTWLECAKAVRKNAVSLKKRKIDADRFLAKFYHLVGNTALLENQRLKAFYFFFRALLAKPDYLPVYKGLLKVFLPARVIRERYENYFQQSGRAGFLAPYY